MTQLYGWINIEDYNGDSNDIEELIKEIECEGLFIKRTIMNAVHMINMSSCHNHFGKLEKSVIDFYYKIANVVDSESYGLLYIYDQEGQNGHIDKFQVLRLAKNVVTVVDDPFFSPYSEKIADYSEDDF